MIFRNQGSLIKKSNTLSREELIDLYGLNSYEFTQTNKDEIFVCSKNKIDMICPKASNSEYNMVSEAYEKNISVRNWGIKDEKDLINAYNSGSKGTTIDWPTRGKEVILRYENNKISN